MYKIKVKKEVVIRKIEENEIIVDMIKFTAIKLVQFREALGLNQADLAKKTTKEGNTVPEISRATISMLESGKGNTTMITLSVLAKALNVNVYELIPGKEDLATEEEIEAAFKPDSNLEEKEKEFVEDNSEETTKEEVEKDY